MAFLVYESLSSSCKLLLQKKEIALIKLRSGENKGLAQRGFCDVGISPGRNVV